MGKAWVWTGEWEAPPEDGWEAFGSRSYDQGGFLMFPWGLLGSRPAHDKGEPRFDLHTTTELKDFRDRFLFSDLTVIFSEMLKTTGFLWPRYSNSLGKDLNDLERKIIEATEMIPGQEGKFSIQTMEYAVRDLARQLFDLSRCLAELDQDARGAVIARDAIAQLLESNGASDGGRHYGGILLGPVDLIGRQMQTNLEYFKTTQQRGQLALDTYRTLVEIAQTKVQNRLTVIGVMLGVFIGLGQLLTELPVVLRLLISVGGGIICSLIYWLWSARKIE